MCGQDGNLAFAGKSGEQAWFDVHVSLCFFLARLVSGLARPDLAA